VVLLTLSRLLWRQPRYLVGTLLNLLDEAALARGVGGSPVRGAVELARLVQRCLEGVLVLFAPLTTAGSPRASLANSHSLRAGRALVERLLEAQPQVDVKSWLDHIMASQLADLISWPSCRSWV
jgi:hypothetical protein